MTYADSVGQRGTGMGETNPRVEIQHNAGVTLRSMSAHDRARVLEAVDRLARHGVSPNDPAVKLIDRSEGLYVYALEDLRIAFTAPADGGTLTVVGLFDADFLDRLARDEAHARAQ